MKWTIEKVRAACDKSFYFFVKFMGSASIPPSGADIIPEIHKPLCEFLQNPENKRTVIVMPRAWRKCVHPDTKIQMANGTEKRIADISIGDRIIGYNGFSQVVARVTNKWNSTANLFEIKFRSGRSIIASDKHRFLQVDGSYKSLPIYGAYPKKLNTKPTSGMNLENASLISYFITEGSLTSGNIGFTNGNNEICKDFERLVKNKGWSFRKWKVNNCFQYDLNGGKNKWNHTKGPRGWCRKYNIYDKLAYEKSLPNSIMSAKLSIAKRVIEIFFATDGTITTKRGGSQVSYCSASKELCFQIQNLLMRFGFSSTINYIKNNCHGAFQLRLSGSQNIKKFLEQFSIIGKEKIQEKILAGLKIGNNNAFCDLLPYETKKLIKERNLRKCGIRIDNHYRLSLDKAKKIPSLGYLINANLRWDDVVSCVPVGSGMAVDLETTSNNFIANGIITHNSTVFTQWFSIWSYLHNHDIRILIVSENKKLARDKLRKIQKQCFGNERLRKFYPELKILDRKWIHAHRWSGDEMDLPTDGSQETSTITAIGIGGASQGGHYDLILLDDIIGEKAMKSPVVLEGVLMWLDNLNELTVEPDWTNPNTSRISIVGTFWAPGDALAYIATNYPEFKWKKVSYLKDTNLCPAEWINNQNVGQGESNYPQFPTSMIVDMLANPEKHLVALTQHLNQPEKAGELTKFDTKAWLRYYHFEYKGDEEFIVCDDDKEEFPTFDIQEVACIDPGGFADSAFKGSRNAIVVGCQPIGTVKKFITHTWAGRPKEPSVFLDKVFEMYKARKPRKVLIETIGAQEYIKRDLQQEMKKRGINFTLLSMEKNVSKGYKDDCIQAVIPIMSNGELYVHRSMKELIAEFAAYPNGITNDLVDMCGKLTLYCWKRGKKPDISLLNQKNRGEEGRNPISGY